MWIQGHISNMMNGKPKMINHYIREALYPPTGLNEPTCTPEGHHSYWKKVNDVRLLGGELLQPDIKQTDKDERPQGQDVTCRGRKEQMDGKQMSQIWVRTLKHIKTFAWNKNLFLSYKFKNSRPSGWKHISKVFPQGRRQIYFKMRQAQWWNHPLTFKS